MKSSPKRPLIIGLTGSIGMGKSTVAKILRGFGLSVYDADKAVHELLGIGGKAVKPIAKLFPETFKNNAIDRKKLGAIVFAAPEKLRKLEHILHPLVQQQERAFITTARKEKASAVVLEIPLLFETGADKRCDVVLCVTAPRAIQKARVLKRKGMTEAKFRAILSQQTPDPEKRRRADFVIKTGGTLAETGRQLRAVIAGLKIP